MKAYIAVRFNPNQSRTYTYHYDGEDELAPGDLVRVPAPDGDGWKAVEVASVGGEEPPFPTKAIICRHIPEDEGNTEAEENPHA